MKSKVLVADDSPTIQKVIDITLASEACTLDQALSVEQLFEQIEASQYNLILLDFCLADEMNGFDLAKKILQESPESSIIMMFGTFDVYEESQLVEAGVYDKIVKPFDGKKFITLCRQIFRLEQVQEPEPVPEPEQVREPEPEPEPEQLQGPEAAHASDQAKSIVSEFDDDDGDEDSSPYSPNIELVEGDVVAEIAGLSEDEESIGSDWCVDAPSPSPEEISPADEPEATNDSLTESEDPLLQEVEGWGFSVPGVIGSDERDQLVGEVPAVIEDDVVEAEDRGQEQLWHVDNGEEEIPTCSDSGATLPTALEIGETMREEIEERVSAVVEDVVRKYCHEMVERVAWEVIPDLAENLIKQELKSLSDSIK
jgi:CheY-like chemotaxis protein